MFDCEAAGSTCGQKMCNPEYEIMNIFIWSIPFVEKCARVVRRGPGSTDSDAELLLMYFMCASYISWRTRGRHHG